MMSDLLHTDCLQWTITTETDLDTQRTIPYMTLLPTHHALMTVDIRLRHHGWRRNRRLFQLRASWTLQGVTPDQTG